jgi:hypothetical protein
VKQEKSDKGKLKERMVWKIIAVLVFFAVACPLRAQEVFVSGGLSHNADTGTGKPEWSISYLQGLGEHLAFSITYLNEGHQSDQHRDGLAPQIWGRINTMEKRLGLAAGIGFYAYCDSDLSPPGDAYRNVHGVGAISSVAATWYGESPLLFQLRANYIVTPNSFDSLSATFGIGYLLDAQPEAGSSGLSGNNARAAENEIAVLLGASVLNNSRSDQSFAQNLEYRRSLSRYFEWTAAFINEGSSSSSDRYGFATPLGAGPDFFEDRLTLGVGAGPYFAWDTKRDDGGNSTTAGMVSLTTSYRFSPHWAVRLTWNRVLTNYDRDSDLFMGGLAYRF